MSKIVIDEISSWIESLQARNYSPATVRIRRDGLVAFRRYLAQSGIDRFQDVSLARLDEWRAQMFSRGLSPSTVEQHLRSVRLLFDWLERRGLMFENPARRMRLHQKPTTLPLVPTPEQVRAAIENPDVATPLGLRDRALLELMYGTGMRLEETARLETTDLDLDEQTVRVRGKGGRERLLPLGRSCLEWLQRYLSEARPSLLGSEPDETRFWLGVTRRGPPTKQALACRVKQHMRAAGLPPRFSAHALRRAAATHMLANGASPFAIREMLGHASMAHLGCYLRVSITDLREMHRKSCLGK